MVTAAANGPRTLWVPGPACHTRHWITASQLSEGQTEAQREGVCQGREELTTAGLLFPGDLVTVTASIFHVTLSSAVPTKFYQTRVCGNPGSTPQKGHAPH